MKIYKFYYILNYAEDSNFRNTLCHSPFVNLPCKIIFKIKMLTVVILFFEFKQIAIKIIYFATKFLKNFKLFSNCCHTPCTEKVKKLCFLCENDKGYYGS